MTEPGPQCPGCGADVATTDQICPSCDLPLRPPERRLVTLLFADLTGYTRLCQDLDPEDVHLTVAPLMSRLRRTAESLGALVESVQGDGFLAAWGAVRVHSDDVDRAVAAAARMQHEVTAWRSSNPELHLELPGLHASIHLDEVLVAPARSTTGVSVTGDGVNVGSRLCGVAGEGRVLLSREALAVLAPDVPHGPVETFAIRGRDRPVDAAELHWHEYVERRGARPLRAEVPLVDRTDLRAALTVLAETGGAAVLVGEPGVGKSRVISEVVRDLEKWVVLRGSVPGFGSLGWTEPLGTALRSVADDGTVGSLGTLAEGWSPSPLGERRLLRLLGSSGTGSEPDSEAALAGAFEEWWRAVALHHPVALVIDDLHHASPPLLEFLRRLAQPSDGHQVLVLGTARDEVTTWEGLPVIPVVPLPPADVSELVERLLPGARPELAAALAERTGGNPLFAEEIAALLLDRGSVELTDHGVTVLSPESTADIPAGLRLLVLARLDLLSPVALATIRGAAVFGPGVDEESLELLLSTVDVRVGLIELAERGMLIATAGTWSFRHALLRDVVYGSLARAQRGRMHVTAAALCAAQRSGPGDSRSGYHLHAAWESSRSSIAPQGDLALAWRAVEELLSVAEHLTTRRPHAARLLLELVDQTAQALPPADSGRLRVRSHVLRLEALLTEGAEAEVLERSAELLAGGGEIGPLADRDRAEVLMLRGHAEWNVDQLSAAERDLTQAAQIFDGVGVPARAAQARALSAFTATGTLPELIAGHLQGWAPAIASGNVKVQLHLATNLAIDLSVIASEDAARWRAVADQLIGPRDHEARAWLDLAAAYCEAFTLDWARCLDRAQRATQVGRETESVQLTVQPAMLVPEAAIHLGDTDTAAAALADLQAQLRGRASPRGRFYHLATSGLLAARTGDHATARDAIAAADSALESIPASDHEWWLTARAHCSVWAGDWSQAAADAQRAIDLAAEHGQSALAIVPHLQRVSVGLGELSTLPDLAALDALLGFAPDSVAAELTRRWRQQHELLGGTLPPLSLLAGEPRAATTDEQRALDLEIAALRGGSPADLLAAAALWDGLLLAVWAARARVWHAVATDRPLPATEFPDELVSHWVDQWSSRRS